MAIAMKFASLADGTVGIELTANLSDTNKPEWKAALNCAVVVMSGFGQMSRPHDCPRITRAQMTLKTPSGESITRDLGKSG
jgi:hypothetical protein